MRVILIFGAIRMEDQFPALRIHADEGQPSTIVRAHCTVMCTLEIPNQPMVQAAFRPKLVVPESAYMPYCPACAKMNPDNSTFCNTCGSVLSTGQKPSVRVVDGRPKYTFLKILVVGIGALMLYGMISSMDSPSPNIAPASPSVSNDAELLLSRCGPADRDSSTENDDPRPPIPTRFIEYKKAHLKFAYVPGAGSKVGDPPPFRWKFFGIIDTRTGKAITADEIKGTLQHRLPCSLPK